ncbi:hypothetical protein COO91_10518 (plasmid) [Nostoc flagelliforme CCNUN1]|uniref:Uncharacterized protein n=2 Tax=Nostoc flagelliforme TaxID=1306274 RepID=A0A2K8TB33_9NOSO|nr:hypothetical protein COO91_10518 [Nostoc flagelliforme CCNUN1]
MEHNHHKTEAHAANDWLCGQSRLLGVECSPSKLLGDKQINPSNDQLPEISPSNDISPSKMRRHKGEGSGSIHWRVITKNGKNYHQAYYHYKFWSEGDRRREIVEVCSQAAAESSSADGVGESGNGEILQVLGVMKSSK